MLSFNDQAEHDATDVSGLPVRFRKTSKAIAFLVATLGLVVLCGWAFNLPLLTYIRPSLQSMKVNTALSFMCLGAALWLAGSDERERSRGILGLLVVIIAGATLAEYAFRVSLGIDQLLFRDTRIPSLSAYPGRMAIATAICFLLLGSAVLSLGVKSAVVLQRALVAACFAFSLAALCGYLYGVKSLYSITSFSTIGVHTAAGLMAACIAYFLARPNEGIVSIAASNSNSGLLLRKLVPLIIVVPILIGWLTIAGHRANLYDTPFEAALLVLGSIVCLGVSTTLVARSMYRWECRSSHAEMTTRESEERLHLAAQAAKMYAFEWDITTDVVVRSSEYVNVLGATEPQTLTHEQVLEKIHPDDRPKLTAAVARHSPENPTVEVTYRVLRPGKPPVWVKSSGCAFFDGEGRMLRVTGMVADVSDHKQAEEALSGMSRKLVEAQEQERARIARELHDDIGQQVGLLGIELTLVQQQHPDLPSEVQSRVQELLKQTTGVSSALQALSHDLHSSQLEYLGVVAGMKSWCKEFGERQGMQIDSRYEVRSTLPPDIGLCLFRVQQEALHNAAKHSGVKRMEVQLREDSGEMHLIISDSGKGFDIEAARKGRGLGLTSMQERVQLVNGTIEIQSRPMGGTTIHACVPFAAVNESAQAAG